MPRGRKECPCCATLVATRASSCKCGHVFKSKKKKVKTTSKKQILYRLVDVPPTGKTNFYSREFKLLNTLIDRYSLEFMNVVTFNKKFDSLGYLVSNKLKETLDRKFRAFNFKIDLSRYDVYDIGEKVGEDTVREKTNKTIKDFLDE